MPSYHKPLHPPHPSQIYARPKNTKADFFKLYSSVNPRKIVIDNPINHEQPFKEKTSEITTQSLVLDTLMSQQLMGRLFVQRINNTPIFDGDHFRAMAKGSHKGFPDILVVKNGHIIFIEVKSNNGKQSEQQKEVEQLLLKQGAEYYLVRSLAFLIEKLKI